MNGKIMNDIINKVITITGIETKSTARGKVFLKVKDQDNKSYQLWQTKADGTHSVAFTRLEELGGAMAVGKNIEIGYKEEAGDYQGKAITYKTIVNIRPTTQPARGQTIVNLQRAEASKKSDDDKWAEISKGKVRHGVACEFIRLGAEYEPKTIAKINKWTEFIMTGEMFNDSEPVKIEDLGEEVVPDNFPF